MILESGSKSELKLCMFENIRTVICARGHVVIVPDTSDPLRAAGMVNFSYNNLCCTEALTATWLKQAEQTIRQIPNNPAATSLADVIKVTRSLFLTQ